MAETKFPVPKFHFRVEINDSPISFQEVSGLDQEFEYLEFRPSNDKDFVTEKRLGLLKTGTISMKRGIVKNDKKLIDILKDIYGKKSFHSTVDSGKLKAIIVVLKDEKGQDVIKWKIKKPVPVKITGTDLNSQSNEVSIEQIDFVHSGIEME